MSRRMRNLSVGGAPLTARETVVRPAPALEGHQIADLRQELRLSQPVFAQALNVSPETVRAWEQGKRSPDGAALRLLEVARVYPQALLSSVETSASRKR